MDAETPDIYITGVQFSVSPFDMAMLFQLRPAAPSSTTPPEAVGTVRMSLEHAKVMAILLKKVLKNHEEAQGSPIVLHPQIYASMGISPTEDW